MDSWQSYEFSSIAKLSKDKFDPKKEKDNAVCIELEHISKETGRLIGSTNSDIQLSTKTVFKKGQVLFGKLRPNLKKYIYCAFDGVCSSEIWVLAPQRNIYPKFLFYLVQQEKFIASACIVSGSKMPRADWNYVSNIPFSIPPKREQKAIADILQAWDTAIEKTEALIAAKGKQFDWLKKQLFDGDFKSYSGKLADYASIPRQTKITSVNGLPPLTVKLHCNGIKANERDVQIFLSDKGRPYYQRKSGEFLIGRQNFHNGGFGIVPEELDGFIASNAITTLELDNSKLDTQYLFFFFSRKDYYLRIKPHSGWHRSERII